MVEVVKLAEPVGGVTGADAVAFVYLEVNRVSRRGRVDYAAVDAEALDNGASIQEAIISGGAYVTIEITGEDFDEALANMNAASQVTLGRRLVAMAVAKGKLPQAVVVDKEG